MNDRPEELINILIVDDDKSFAEVLRDEILKENVVVWVCSDGAEATDLIAGNNFHLVITDLMMPKIGGLGVLQHAKKINPETIVVIITGYATLESAIEAIRQGAYDYIRKPFKLDELHIVVNNAIDRICLIRENRKLIQELDHVYKQLVILKEQAKRTVANRGDNANENSNDYNIPFYPSGVPYLYHMNGKAKSGLDYVSELERLTKLKQEGFLAEGEFKTFKDYLLRQMKGRDF
ncbi:MAG: response regulator [Pseudomonadota bacterium]